MARLSKVQQSLLSSLNKYDQLIILSQFFIASMKTEMAWAIFSSSFI